MDPQIRSESSDNNLDIESLSTGRVPSDANNPEENMMINQNEIIVQLSLNLKALDSVIKENEFKI